MPGSAQGANSWSTRTPCVTIVLTMNTPHTAPSSGHATVPGARRATRSSEGRLVGGVAAGLAEHLGVDVMLVRAAFVITTVFGGLGVAMYAGLWMILPTDARFEEAAPGLDAARRQGKRPDRRSRRLEDVGPLVALAAVALVLLGPSIARAVPIEFGALSQSQGFNYSKDVQEPFGHLVTLTFGGSPTGLQPQADFAVRDPAHTTAISVVGVLASFSWDGGRNDPIDLDFLVSTANKIFLNDLVHKTLSNTDVTFSFTIWDYDPIRKAYFVALRPQATLQGQIAKDGKDLQKRLLDLPGIGEMKARTITAVLAKRLGVSVPGLDDVLPDYPTLGDVDSADALASYQAGKRAKKAEMRAQGKRV